MAKRTNPKLIGAFVIGAIALAIAGVLAFGGGQYFTAKIRAVVFFPGASLSGLDVGSRSPSVASRSEKSRALSSSTTWSAKGFVCRSALSSILQGCKSSAASTTLPRTSLSSLLGV